MFAWHFSPELLLRLDLHVGQVQNLRRSLLLVEDVL